MAGSGQSAGQNPHPDTSEVFLAGENERSEKVILTGSTASTF